MMQTESDKTMQLAAHGLLQWLAAALLPRWHLPTAVAYELFEIDDRIPRYMLRLFTCCWAGCVEAL